jgi:TonB family protein
MTRAERFPWLKRDGAPFAISLVLHVLLLLLLAPWLVMRTIPDTQLVVEVMLEPDTKVTPRSRPEQTTVLKGPTKAQRPLVQPKPRPVQTPAVVTARIKPEPQTPPLASNTPAAETGQGQTGRSAPAPREVAGLSAPNTPGLLSAAAPASIGASLLQPASEQTSPLAPQVAATREAGTLSAMRNPDVRYTASPLGTGLMALQRGSEEASPAAPQSPSQGSIPQPSARAAAAPSRPGEDRQDGPVTLAGPAAQVQSAQPEFRQASRQGGQVSMRGGSKAPSDGLASQAGSPEQVALLAARSVPQSLPGSGAAPGAPAMVAPVARSSGQGSAAASENAAPSLAQSAASAPGTRSGSVTAAKAPTLATPAARTSTGQGSSVASENTDSSLAQSASSGTRSENAPTGQAPTLAAPATRSGSVQTSTAASESAGSGLTSAAAPATGPAAAVASRAPSTGGQTSAGTGTGSRTANPSEQGRSGLMAAATQAEPGTGTALAGGGPGASEAGQGRSQVRAGSGSAAREAASPLLASAGSAAAAASAGADSSAGQLSGRAETVALAQSAGEARVATMQIQKPSGQARVIEERFSASTLKVDSPRTICSLPLMFAGLDRKPIPQGLDSINSTAARLQDETPPRHYPTNQSPRFPLAAIASRAQGRVLVRAEIRPDGSIGKRWIKQSSGMPVLDQAALETVNGWRFYPAQRHGLAVAVWIDVPIEYKLP